MRHAYLIMAHGEFDILEKLLVLIDDSCNDIYIHIDKKAKNPDFSKLGSIPKKSKVFFTDRIDVSWGERSQIDCELILLKAACSGNYDYYHLLSGVDLPLKSQREIQDFFKDNNGKQFVHMVGYKTDILKRISLYHPFAGLVRRASGRYRKRILSYLVRIFNRIQELVGVDRLKDADFDVKYGANWFSITHDLAEYVVSKEDFIDKYFRSSLCADELFLQTIVYNSRFRNDLYRDNENSGYMACLRYVVWDRDDCKDGSPHVWKSCDYDELINSDYLFARKFDSSVDNDIINKIFHWVQDRV